MQVKFLLLNKKNKGKKILFELLILLLLFLTVVVINWTLIRNGTHILGDLKWHLTWIQHFYKQFNEGIWYPRWLEGTNYGYGSPTFVFYPPIVYYIASALKLFGLDTEKTLIALLSLALFGAGCGFYLYGRNRWGRIASFTGALCYISSPYIILNLYNRGALAEIWALVWLPLIFWLTDQAIVFPKWRLPLALSFTVLALTHTPSLLMYAIFWLPYTLIFLGRCSWKAVLATVLSAGMGLGVASFYLMPAILEQPLVNIANMRKGGGGFQSNLIYIMYDKFRPIQMAVNHIFNWELLAIVLLIFVAWLYHRKNSNKIQEVLLWLCFSIALVFLMTHLSVLIWQKSPTLQMIQFPWRLLGLFSFACAASCSLAMNGVMNSRFQPKTLLSLLIIIAIIGGYFGSAYQVSRSSISIHNPKNSDPNLELYQRILYQPYTDKLTDFPDFRPALGNGSTSPPTPVIGQPKVSVVSGQAFIQIAQWQSYTRTFNITAETTATIRVRTYYYPAWHLYINQKPHPIGMSSDGTIKLQLEPGSYTAKLHYQWTRAFTLGVVLSIFSLVALLLLWIKISRISRYA